MAGRQKSDRSHITVSREFADDDRAAVAAYTSLLIYSRERNLAALYPPSPELIAEANLTLEQHQAACRDLDCFICDRHDENRASTSDPGHPLPRSYESAAVGGVNSTAEAHPCSTRGVSPLQMQSTEGESWNGPERRLDTAAASPSLSRSVAGRLGGRPHTAASTPEHKERASRA